MSSWPGCRVDSTSLGAGLPSGEGASGENSFVLFLEVSFMAIITTTVTTVFTLLRDYCDRMC